MANNFFIYKNIKVGKSLVEDNTNNIIEKIYNEANKNKISKPSEVFMLKTIKIRKLRLKYTFFLINVTDFL